VILSYHLKFAWRKGSFVSYAAQTVVSNYFDRKHPIFLTYSKINCLTKPFLILYFFPFIFFINGQTVRRPVAAVYTGLGAYSINHVDVFSFSNNQASLAQMKNASAGVYGERRSC
jgi:hypothetical protein